MAGSFTASTGAATVMGNMRVIIGTLTATDGGASQGAVEISTPFRKVFAAIGMNGTTNAANVGMVWGVTAASSIRPCSAASADTFKVMILGW